MEFDGQHGDYCIWKEKDMEAKVLTNISWGHMDEVVFTQGHIHQESVVLTQCTVFMRQVNAWLIIASRELRGCTAFLARPEQHSCQQANICLQPT